MRSGGCAAMQHGLSGAAAAAVKQAVALARRRGHAQVTPLHVAAAMLSIADEDGGGATLFLRACVSSHSHVRSTSHPLQSRALELCFGVALNRLPTTSPPFLSSPSLSNALVAALKRAQAQQRRGCGDAPAAASTKVELEQLVISVLDDPSVSRVMREAGFSSTCVKKTMEEKWGLLIQEEDEEDVKFLTDVLISGKNAVLVGDDHSRESIVRKLMNRLKMGKMPEALRSVNLIKFQLYPDEVEKRVEEMRRKVEAFSLPWSGGVIIYVGDLRWAETRELEREAEAKADFLVAEVARLVREKGKSRVWIMAAASHQTYQRCKTRCPSLESLWALQPVPVPSDGLYLSLHARSDCDSRLTPELREETGEKMILPFWLKCERPGGHLGSSSVSEKRRKRSMIGQDIDHKQMKRQCLPNFPWKNHNLGDSTVEFDCGGSSFLLEARTVNGKSDEIIHLERNRRLTSPARNFDLNVSAEEGEDEDVTAMNTSGDPWNASNFPGSLSMNARHSQTREIHFPSTSSSFV